MSPNLANYSPVLKNCFISVSLEQLCHQKLSFFVNNKCNPEISLEGNFLWHVQQQDIERVASALEKHNLCCTLHAPFQDLVPGGFDDKFVALTRRKLQKAFSLTTILQPKSIVCHLGFNPLRHERTFDHWLTRSAQTWEELLPMAIDNNVQIMFENTYELTPAPHLALLSRLEPFKPKFCLDTGHVIAFSKTDWQIWLEQMLPWLEQIHLHDNDGVSDAHLPVGSGIFNFPGLFHKLKQNDKQVLCTFEQRTEENLLRSLQYISSITPDFSSHISKYK